MRIELLGESALKWTLTEEREWYLFEKLAEDVEGRGEGWLAKRLGVLMDDEEWDELVAPGLTEQFRKDFVKVESCLRTSYEEWQRRQVAEEAQVPSEADADDEEELELELELEYGEIVVDQENSDAWYSVLNQARLSLEGKWKLSALKDEEDFGSLETIGEERLSAFLRDGFYTRLQGVILEKAFEL